jgi:hypothetical protein
LQSASPFVGEDDRRQQDFSHLFSRDVARAVPVRSGCGCASAAVASADQVGTGCKKELITRDLFGQLGHLYGRSLGAGVAPYTRLPYLVGFTMQKRAYLLTTSFLVKFHAAG